ncbi:MAG TPA: acetyl/propionyl/methylcrotonyl-CoA carboxylase subunit alpha [Methylocella sp.]|nr:acetyl/propionyl/methylcrotonyl-CoA carboxylase subunit alpha [Methylocella sp.]
MFKKILIANRGEIACRVIKTARKMGIATVAVYSDADRAALHVELADEAVRIGPPPAPESYLVVENMIRACKATGAEAVHPGYGFLSEQAAFARALLAEGIAFIGPNAGAIEAMGDKIEAKRRAHEAGVATVPGFLGTIEDLGEAEKIAAEIGYPLMIKAAAGGGGRGMRLISSREELAEGFARASSEAKSAFGDGRVFIEKFIAGPRHIEVQILGDRHGNVIHLGERECSIQRRHQKVIEEAPSPCVDAKQRAAMGAQAVALARTVGYDSAGTVEFLAAGDGGFYFLEMNTRLQVEHPVTELITGIDLVDEMIRSAAGERLRLTQEDVSFHGAALECRILAEDPARNFLPSTGRLKTYRLPAIERRDGFTLRIDSGVREGDEILIHYDSMIAKLVTHAPDRGAAIAGASQALDAFAIDGVANNLAFLASILGRECFRLGKLSTNFIADEYPRGFAPAPPEGTMAELFASIAAAADLVLKKRRRTISGQWRAAAPPAQFPSCSVMVAESRYDIILEETAEQLLVRFEASGGVHSVASQWVPGQPVWFGTVDGAAIAVQLRPVLNGYHLNHGGFAAATRVFMRREADLALLMPKKKAALGANVLRCPMPCLVRSIAVTEGQVVTPGEALCVLEAMKMETVIRADSHARVTEIYARPGDFLAVDAVIMAFA